MLLQKGRRQTTFSRPSLAGDFSFIVTHHTGLQIHYNKYVYIVYGVNIRAADGFEQSSQGAVNK